MAAIQERFLEAALSTFHGASNSTRAINSGGGSTSAARSMNSTAAAESPASAAQAGHSARWRSTSAAPAASTVPST